MFRSRGIPANQIAQRYRITNKGQIEFKTDSGQWQREISEHPLAQLKKFGATVAAHPSTYTGTIGALAAGAPGAVGGAMIGESGRKLLGRTIYDEPQNRWANLFDIGLEG